MNPLVTILLRAAEKTIEEIAKEAAKSAALSAIGEGAISAIGGERDGKEIAKDVGCGAFTGAAGTLAQEAYKHFTDNAGVKGVLVGIGGGVVARHMYRRVLPRKSEPPHGGGDRLKTGSTTPKNKGSKGVSQ